MKVYKYGDNVDTDVIIPARHLNDPDPKALASDFASGKIVNESTGKEWQAAPFPEFVNGIIEQGGLMNSLKARGIAK